MTAILAATLSSGAATLVVDNKAPNAKDDNPGTEAAPFKTIDAAAQVAQPGDTVLVHAGTYRERVSPARGGTAEAPIAYMAAPGETVCVKGSEVWTPEWKIIDSDRRIMEGALDPAWFKDFNPYLTRINSGDGTPAGASPARPVRDGERPEKAGDVSSDEQDPKTVDRPRLGKGDYPETLGQVFVNGEPYYQALNRNSLMQTEGSWLVNEAGDGIVVHFRQNKGSSSRDEVEISVRNRIFLP